MKWKDLFCLRFSYSILYLWWFNSKPFKQITNYQIIANYILFLILIKLCQLCYCYHFPFPFSLFFSLSFQVKIGNEVSSSFSCFKFFFHVFPRISISSRCPDRSSSFRKHEKNEKNLKKNEVRWREKERSGF